MYIGSLRMLLEIILGILQESLYKKSKIIFTTVLPQRFKRAEICICSQYTKKFASMLEILPILPN